MLSSNICLAICIICILVGLVTGVPAAIELHTKRLDAKKQAELDKLAQKILEEKLEDEILYSPKSVHTRVSG